MKDKFIQQKLDAYANAVKPSEKVLEGAILELDSAIAARQRGEEKRGADFKWSRFARVAQAAVFMIVIIALVLWRFAPFDTDSKNDPTIPKNYQLASLISVVAQSDDIEKLSEKNAVKVLNIDTQTPHEAKYYIFKGEDDTVYAVKIVYRVERDGCIDEVVVISDIYGGLTDVSKRIYYDTFENGEYYSNVYYASDGLAYYLSIMSPNSGGGDFYESLVF